LNVPELSRIGKIAQTIRLFLDKSTTSGCCGGMLTRMETAPQNHTVLVQSFSPDGTTLASYAIITPLLPSSPAAPQVSLSSLKKLCKVTGGGKSEGQFGEGLSQVSHVARFSDSFSIPNLFPETLVWLSLVQQDLEAVCRLTSPAKRRL
jgi:hypothetical protein